MQKKKNPLDEAFDILFPNYENYPISRHKKADMVIKNLNVRKIGEENAFRVCCEIILRVNFPSRAETTNVVGRAEHLLPEILGTNPDHEYHMDEVENLERKYFELRNGFDNFVSTLH